MQGAHLPFPFGYAPAAFEAPLQTAFSSVEGAAVQRQQGAKPLTE